MGVRIQGLVTVAALAIASGTFTEATLAQNADETVPGVIGTVEERFDRVYFKHDSDFYNNRSLGEQLDWIFGFGGFENSFLENEITSDGEALNELTEEMLLLQAHSTPIIRTIDAENPFDSSVLSVQRFDPLEAVPLPPNIPRTRASEVPSTSRPDPVPALY